ncbi:hypothetical protein GALL_32020 [mine drainage metagenome]|uniref:Uncharacterized protein n=1 Tax=mine drainage metagenome TaxID=410659 RepID=A0A1J5TJL3_9ZZZZ
MNRATLAAFIIPLAVTSTSTCFASAAETVPDDSFLSNWLGNVSKTQELQPHWETLLYMPSPRLTQGLRLNYSRQYFPGGSTLENFGMGKGLELIVDENVEVQIGVPPYINSKSPKGDSSGWADETFVGRYRLASANEENGNYIVSSSIGVSIPSGSDQFSAHSSIYTLALAGGKGWGTRESGVSIQSTVSMNAPDNDLATIGMPLSWTTALQAHVLQNIWPEIEASYTHWYKGILDGRSQLVMTYGITFGRFEIENREKLTFGIGYQEPRFTHFSNFSRTWVSTMKLSF